MEPGRQRAEAWLADCTRAQREADRNAQQPAQLGAGEEIAGPEGQPGSRDPIEAQEGSGAARACAHACPAPAIHLPSCRSDGICPECNYVPAGGYRFTSLAPCGCTVCVICEPVHLRALLTEALRLLKEARNG